MLGSLSHLLNRYVPGYRELPDWPAIPPNPWSRVVQSTATPVVSSGSPASSVLDQKPNSRVNHLKSLRDFLSDSESEEDTEEEEEEESEGEEEMDEKLGVEGMPKNAVYEEKKGDESSDDDLIPRDNQNGARSARKTVKRASLMYLIYMIFSPLNSPNTSGPQTWCCLMLHGILQFLLTPKLWCPSDVNIISLFQIAFS